MQATAWIRQLFRRRVTLRGVLHLGRKMEQQAVWWYEQYATQTESEQIKALCLKLADEERTHVNLIETRLGRWKTARVSRRELERLDADGTLRNLFLSPPGPEAPTESFVSFAIEQEKRMVDFYTQFEAHFSHEWKIRRLDELIEEEKDHVRQWSRILKPAGA